MPLHPALLELRTELERQGSVVVCHSDYICLRLPLVASVRIRLEGGQLRLEPRFAMFSRGTSLVLTPIIAVLAVAFVASLAPMAPLIVTAFAATLTVLYDLARLIMTEGTMTRVQLLWTTRPAPMSLEAGQGDAAAIPTRATMAGLPAGGTDLASDRTPRPVQAGQLRR